MNKWSNLTLIFPLFFPLCSCEVWPHVKKAAWQSLRRGSEAPAVPGTSRGSGQRYIRPHWWRGWRERQWPQSGLQSGLQHHPQRSGWHNHTTRRSPLWSAAHTGGSCRLLQFRVIGRKRREQFVFPEFSWVKQTRVWWRDAHQTRVYEPTRFWTLHSLNT